MQDQSFRLRHSSGQQSRWRQKVLSEFYYSLTWTPDAQGHLTLMWCLADIAFSPPDVHKLRRRCRLHSSRMQTHFIISTESWFFLVILSVIYQNTLYHLTKYTIRISVHKSNAHNTPLLWVKFLSTMSS